MAARKRIRIIKKVRETAGKWRFVSLSRIGDRYVWDQRPGYYFLEWWEGRKRRRQVAGQTPSEAMEAQRRKAMANPCAYFKPLKDEKAKARRKPPTYSQEEIDRLFAACDDFEKAILATLLLTGLRKQELYYLTWPDMDFKEAKGGEQAQAVSGNILKTTITERRPAARRAI